MSINPDPLALLTIEQVAELTGTSVDTIKRSIKATEPKGMVRPFPGWKWQGRKRVITRAAVQAWLESLPNA